MKDGRLNRTITHAKRNAVAYLALFIALGGTSAYAAEKALKKESVATKHLKTGAVTTPKLGPGAVGPDAVADGSLGAAELAPGTLPDMTQYYDKAAADSAFLTQAEGDDFYYHKFDADAMFLDRPEGDDRYQRGKTIAKGYLFADNGAERELVNIPYQGSVRASCERQSNDRATIYWNPTTQNGAAASIWMEGGNGAGLTEFERHHQSATRASMQMSHDDRATIDVYGPGGITSLTVISRLSDGLGNGGQCEFFVLGNHSPFVG